MLGYVLTLPKFNVHRNSTFFGRHVFKLCLHIFTLQNYQLSGRIYSKQSFTADRNNMSDIAARFHVPSIQQASSVQFTRAKILILVYKISLKYIFRSGPFHVSFF